ncbi:MAG: hypothetical protein JJ868_16540 [Shimia sp.]|uniref:hypothetical protein n=1 Tax=Shimia sp. TaxID=1954381 RepID=UPI001B275CD9|nr:hypothetical protein [Shimia sp.]MBO6898980.1 hypothetical protein [Shimia sp.]
MGEDQGFVERYNTKFAKPSRRPDNLHLALNFEPDRLRDILCLRDERYVSQQLAFSYERGRIILEESDVTRGLLGNYVDCYEFPDWRLEFRCKGVSLLYSAFDKDQRVTHAAITENKRLSAVLEFIKYEQNKATPKKQRASKQRTRYEPTGRECTNIQTGPLRVRTHSPFEKWPLLQSAPCAANGGKV